MWSASQDSSIFQGQRMWTRTPEAKCDPTTKSKVLIWVRDPDQVVGVGSSLIPAGGEGVQENFCEKFGYCLSAEQGAPRIQQLFARNKIERSSFTFSVLFLKFVTSLVIFLAWSTLPRRVEVKSDGNYLLPLPSSIIGEVFGGDSNRLLHGYLW